MFDMNDFLKLMKKSAVEAVVASKPADLKFGKVISISPLKIKVDQKLILNDAQLVLSRHVTDYRLSVTFDWETEIIGHHSHGYSGTTASGGSEDPHSHGYGGTTEPNGSHKHKVISNKDKTIVIHNALKIGEQVALFQLAGGQKYFVLDRI